MNQANWSQNAMQHLVKTLVVPVDQQACETGCDQLAIYAERNQRIAQHIHTQRPTNAPKKKRHRRVSYPPTSFSPSVWPEEAVTLGWGDRRGV